MGPGAKSGHRGWGQGESNAGPPGDPNTETHTQALVPLLQATPDEHAHCTIPLDADPESYEI